MTEPNALLEAVRAVLGDVVLHTEVIHDQAVVTIAAPALGIAQHDSFVMRPRSEFEQLTDLCGMDYRDYGNGRHEGRRFAAVVQLLSVALNNRLRVKVFAEDDDFPSVPSVVDVWSGANWFEREAFDLFGIVFPGHPDLRRILTDYGFIGYPFRKDFPVSGYVEMRYDPDQRRVVYQPVSIEQREIVPRVVREENYGDVA